MQFDPMRWGAAVESYLGKFWGRRLIQLAIIAVLLGVIGEGAKLFFKDLIGDLIWPFLMRLFGGTTTGITMDNIEAIIIVLVSALVLFVLMVALLIYVLAGSLRRRTVPQNVIDDLAELRSQGISILNRLPDNVDKLSQAEKDDYVDQDWHPAWTEWGNGVVDFLERHFTKAEKLSFRRLGVIREEQFGLALTPKHGHYLMLLSKQLSILEELIQRHQERR